MSEWIIGTAAIGVATLIAAIIFFIQDNRIMVQMNKKGSYLLSNVSLLILSFFWLILAGYLYLDIQNQLNLFMK